MKILMLTPTLPLPANNGSRIRIWNSIKLLSQFGDITLLSINHNDSEYGHIDKIHEFCDEVHSFELKNNLRKSLIKYTFTDKPYRVVKFWNPLLSKFIANDLLHDEKLDYDIIWCHFMNMADYIDYSVIKRNTLCILDQHNDDILMWKKYAESDNWLYKLIGKINIKRLMKFCCKNVAKFDYCLSVSNEDAEFTRSWATDVKVLTAANGVDVDYFSRKIDYVDGNSIIFCGSMEVTMNVDAVLFFARNIFQKIKEQVPECKFFIVGKNPTDAVLNLHNHDDIIVTGTVNDVRPYYETAKVAVSPFKYGGGTKLKNLEAMAMKVPVVSTKVGCQGIDATDNENILIRDDTQEFANAVIKLLIDEEYHLEIVRKAYKFVNDNYTWDSIYGRVLSDDIGII